MRNLILFLVLAGSAATARGDSTTAPVDAHPREATTSRPWQLGARAGVAVPRADLDPGIVIGGVGRFVIDSRRMLTVDAGLDWSRLGHRGRTMLSPPSFPRSLGELDQQTDLVTIAAGASIRVAELGAVTVTAGAAVGVQLSRTRFHAYLMEAVRTRVAPAATLELSPTLHRADMSEFQLDRRFALVVIPFNAFIHNMTQEAQIRCLSLCREHLLSGGLLAFDTFFPSHAIVGTPENTRFLEGELPHPKTGLPMRMYDTRTFDRVAQTQHSVNELELLDAEGNIAKVHRSHCDSRYVYKNEMELLLRVAGFARREICGDFDRRPLTRETDAMIVMAWTA